MRKRPEKLLWTKNICLTVFFVLSLFNSASANDYPVIDSFTAVGASGNAPLATDFTYMAHDPDGSIREYHIDYGDGSPVEKNATGIFSHTYTTPGTYEAECLVVDNEGATTLSEVITINVIDPPPPPVANFTKSLTQGTAPLIVGFTDTSTSVVTSWQWDFGDGTTSSAQNPTHLYYEDPGQYTVTLTVTGPTGTDTHSDIITITGLHLTKLDANGNELPADAVLVAMIRDDQTGLTWKMDTPFLAKSEIIPYLMDMNRAYYNGSNHWRLPVDAEKDLLKMCLMILPSNPSDPSNHPSYAAWVDNKEEIYVICSGDEFDCLVFKHLVLKNLLSYQQFTVTNSFV